MTVKINLKKAERTLLPDGDYALEIVSAEIVDSKSSEGTNLKLKLVPNTEVHKDLVGSTAKIQDLRALAEESWFRVVELLEAAFGKPEAQDEEGNFEFEEDDLVGKTVGASVYIDDSYDPKHPSNKISAYFPYEEEEAPEPTKKGKK